MRLVLDEVFGHVAVDHLDAAFGEIAGETEVLAGVPARDAMRVGTGPAHGGHDEGAGAKARDAAAGLDHFPKGFMSEPEIFAVAGRGTVGEGADFAVGAANAYFEGADLEFGGGIE